MQKSCHSEKTQAQQNTKKMEKKCYTLLDTLVQFQLCIHQLCTEEDGKCICNEN